MKGWPWATPALSAAGARLLGDAVSHLPDSFAAHEGVNHRTIAEMSQSAPRGCNCLSDIQEILSIEH